ncbi:hypothetical protein SDC9_94938 [bioreactor metagenome]|uniref:Uncharacterized protein n=1 Tax=bioreactor metagenome TaxID=1076179 RepID=A0A645AEW3_9ZZZZ
MSTAVTYAPRRQNSCATRVVPVNRSRAVRASTASASRPRTGTRVRLDPRYLITRCRWSQGTCRWSRSTCRWSQSARRPGVTGVRVTGAVALQQPLLPLRGRAVGPRLPVHPAGGVLLDPVVADGLGGRPGLADVLLGDLGDRPLGVLRRIGEPHAGEAVGLQLGPDGGGVGAGAALAHLAEHADLVLHVVAVLVRHHVRLDRGGRGGAELLLQRGEERLVEVDLLVGRAVEGTDRRGGGAAPGLDLSGEHHELVGRGVALDHAAPVAVQRVLVGDEAALRIGLDVLDRRALLQGVLPGGGAGRVDGLVAAEDVGRVDAEEERHQDQDQAADATDRDPPATATTARRGAGGVEVGILVELHQRLPHRSPARRSRNGPSSPSYGAAPRSYREARRRVGASAAGQFWRKYDSSRSNSV